MNQVEKELLLDMLNNGGTMNRILLNEFIDYVEKQIKLSNEQEYVQDDRGAYQKDLYVKNVISETKELMRYGEEVIAIENMLENLNEVSLSVDEYAIELIRKAFNGKVPKRIEKILNSFTRK